MAQQNSTSKRFGARYGRTVKERVGEVEKLARKTYECPYCLKKKVNRVMAGIWKCEKCGKKFTGKAYTLQESVKEEKEE